MIGIVEAERRALEATYEDEGTVWRGVREVDQNGITGERENVVLENQPCALSRRGGNSALSGRGDASRLCDGWQTLEFERVLFLAPEADVRPGDRIEVTRFGRRAIFSVVGEPLRYATHQQIPLRSPAQPV